MHFCLSSPDRIGQDKCADRIERACQLCLVEVKRECQTVAGTDVLNSLGATSFIAGSQTKIWSLGVTQNIDAAAMQLYLGYHNYSVDAVLLNQSATATNQRARSNPIDDMSLVFTGATIRF